LFAPFDTYLTVTAAFEGTRPAQVFVDDLAAPMSAFLAADGFFVAGRPDNDAFNDAVRSLIAERYLVSDDVVALIAASAAWHARMPALLVREPIPVQQLYYSFGALRLDWRALLPAGCEVRPVDAALLGQGDRRNLAAILEWIPDWGTADAFLAHGFGHCVVHGEVIAAWCLTDCVSGLRCEISVATDPEYQRRGLATIATAATVEAALARGHPQIGWHCWERNHASRGLAEKVGFRLAGSALVHLCLADEAQHRRVQERYRSAL
jgi:GNAT superfamily N-acetyltransferase